jgi:hypothetical protein
MDWCWPPRKTPEFAGLSASLRNRRLRQGNVFSGVKVVNRTSRLEFLPAQSSQGQELGVTLILPAFAGLGFETSDGHHFYRRSKK